VIPPELAAAVRALAARPRLLVGLDFDGVLAPIVEHRDEARPVPGAMDSVRRLARLPGVDVALVSGRALDSLRGVSGVTDEDEATLVGSHGAEATVRPALRERPGGAGPGAAMTPAARERLDRIIDALRQITADAGPGSGLDVELKPTGAVLHVRRAAPDVAREAERRAMAGPTTWPGVHTTQGKSVIEMAVTQTSKGVALQWLRGLTEADAIFYAGDDVTDETAFEVLGPDDVTVKVGPGDSHAAYRLETPDDVAELLQLLVAERSQR
jgi:trehalose 6-phosphate phosphatase